MIDFMLHNQVETRTDVLRSTLRTGTKSGYRAGGNPQTLVDEERDPGKPHDRAKPEVDLRNPMREM